MEKVRIQDDLFNYVNGEWIENAVIPEDKPTTGGFSDLADDVEKVMMGEFSEMSKTENYPNDYLKSATLLYKAVLNVKKRNKDGIKPALKVLAKYDKIDSIAKLNRNMKELVLDGYALPFDFGVQEDMKNSNANALYIQGPSTILPDASYYKEPMKAQGDAILGMWSGIAAQLLKYTPLTEEQQALYLQDTLKFDAIIAGLVKTSLEWSEYVKAYNPMKISKVNSLLKPLKFKKLVTDLCGEAPEQVIVADVRFLKGFNTLFNEENFELFKHWSYVRTLFNLTGVLSEELRDLGSSYMRMLMGIQVMPSVEKYAYQLAGSFYSQPVGLYYGQKYFGEEAKADVIEMVYEIINQYKERIKANAILEDVTKEKAISKLSKMKVKMGYPDKVEEIYDKLAFPEGKSLLVAVMSLERIKRVDNFSQLNKPVNKEKWAMPGHMVNACYNPSANDITFPAAILQAPFYSIKQTRSQNLGGIGAVIAHEISHAFDNNGAKMDEDGNINNWWTKEDNKKFKQSTKAMVKEFEGIVLPWGPVNSELIVSENIADNGGMAVTIDIMNKMKDANFEEYFINWGKIWCMKAKPEYQQMLLNVDVHAPAILRANMQPRNFEEWYKTFNVTKKDKMYIAPNKRVVIW